jgi:crotonobetainyl-CoA:carnitine CoA-transferase CaiB-like acyl-CoA transferase
LIRDCWGWVGGDPAALDRVRVHRRDAWLGGPLRVDDLAVGAVAAALLAATELVEGRGGGAPVAEVDAEHVALSFRSERFQMRRGVPAPAGFSPLSTLVRCAGGGWLRTHGNYAHHAAALGRALGIRIEGDADSTVASVRARAAERDAVELEDAIAGEGGCAAALRSREEWAKHPAGMAVAQAPLVRLSPDLATVATCPWRRPVSGQPCAGIRVLDLTRVIAGPVAGRTLAALGADVLRVDPPRLPELPEQHSDTGPGKRPAVFDLGDAAGREALLAGADVLLTGYRPGSLARFDLAPEAVAARHPHLVHVSLRAWGDLGPWRDRRGFDSLVQVASGIASVCARDDGTPGALPAQALDHATGHLMAAVALRGLARRARGEPVAPATLSLAGTAAALLRAGRPRAATSPMTGRADAAPYMVTLDEMSLIAPPGSLDGIPLSWRHGPRPLGGDPARWW